MAASLERPVPLPDAPLGGGRVAWAARRGVRPGRGLPRYRSPPQGLRLALRRPFSRGMGGGRAAVGRGQGGLGLTRARRPAGTVFGPGPCPPVPRACGQGRRVRSRCAAARPATRAVRGRDDVPVKAPRAPQTAQRHFHHPLAWKHHEPARVVGAIDDLKGEPPWASPRPVLSLRTTVSDGATRREQAGFRGYVDVRVRQTRWIVKRLLTVGVVRIVSEWTQPRAFLYSSVPPVIALSKGPWSR